ncbi:S8 family serine peptidase [Catellatospora methionotrophica]|uniref:S8 family serine peptidase n=1 Tax=Catellatospora methionotrophica TaxID=121620 RepID=UPI0033CFD208
MGRVTRPGLVAVLVAGGWLIPATPAAAAPDCAPPARTVVAELPWAQQWLRPPRIWPLTRGAGVTVAVVDSGVDGQVRQLRGRVESGLDTLAGGRADTDCLGHGTFVAGIVAAGEQPGVGFTGLAPQARILPMRVTADNAYPPSETALAAAIRAAAQRGARVIVVGTPMVRSGARLRAALEEAEARDALVITGSWGSTQTPVPVDPWVTERILSVGGFDPDGGLVSGTAAPVDLMAPGAGVLSLGPRGSGHVVEDGNAYAAAYVAGAAALVRAHHPGLTAAQVKQRLLATSDRVPRKVPDPQLGHGALDLYAAVTAVLPAERGAAVATVPVPAAVVARPQAADDGAFRVGVAVAVAAGLLSLLLVTLTLAAPRIRRRRARPR